MNKILSTIIHTFILCAMGILIILIFAMTVAALGGMFDDALKLVAINAAIALISQCVWELGDHFGLID